MSREAYLNSVAMLRVDLKSLAAELRAIRVECRRASDNSELQSDLQSHRDARVKPAARIAHLALAAVRDLPYSAVERRCSTAPPWDAVLKKLWKHNFNSGAKEKARVHKWLQAAKDYVDSEKARRDPEPVKEVRYA